MLHAPAGCVDLSKGPDIHWTCEDGSELVSVEVPQPVDSFLEAVIALDRLATRDRLGLYARVEQRFYGCRLDRRDAVCLEVSGQGAVHTWVAAPGLDRALACSGAACPPIAAVEEFTLSGNPMADGFESFSVVTDGPAPPLNLADDLARQFRVGSTTSGSTGLTCTANGRDSVCVRVSRPDGVAYVAAPLEGPPFLLVCTTADTKALDVPALCADVLRVSMPGCDAREVAMWVCGVDARPSGGLSMSIVNAVMIEPASGAIPAEVLLAGVLPAAPRKRVTMTFGGAAREVSVGTFVLNDASLDAYLWNGPEGSLACRDVSDDAFGRCERWFDAAYADIRRAIGDDVVAAAHVEPIRAPGCEAGAHQAVCADGSWADLSVALIGSGKPHHYAPELAAAFAEVAVEPPFACRVDGAAASCVRVDCVDETVFVALSETQVVLRCGSASPEAGVVPTACAGRLEF